MKLAFLIFCCLLVSNEYSMLRQQYTKVSLKLMDLLSRLNKIDPNSDVAEDFMARASALGKVKNILGTQISLDNDRQRGG